MYILSGFLKGLCPGAPGMAEEHTHAWEILFQTEAIKPVSQ